MAKKSYFNYVHLALLFAVLFLSGCGKDQDVTAENLPMVKIGVVTALSGNVSVVGEGIQKAVFLAQEDLKKRSLKNKYQFIIEDDAFEARKTAMIFTKFKDLEGVDAILSTFSQTGKVIAPRAEEAKIIHFSISSDAEIANGKYNFLDWSMPESTAGRMLRFYKNRGFKKIVIIVPTNAGALPLANAFTKQLKPEDGIQAAVYQVAPEEKDFKMLLSKTKEEKADAYLTMLYGASIIPFFKQYSESGEKAVVTSIETFASLPDFSLAEGAYFTDAAPAGDDFVARSKKQFGETSTYAMGNMYDMIMLTVEAFERAKDKSSAVEELSKIKTYEGVVGKLWQDDEGIFNSDAVLKKIVNGKPVIVEE